MSNHRDTTNDDEFDAMTYQHLQPKPEVQSCSLSPK